MALLTGKMLCMLINIFRDPQIREECDTWQQIQRFTTANPHKFTHEVLTLRHKVCELSAGTGELIEQKDAIFAAIRELKQLYLTESNAKLFKHLTSSRSMKIIAYLVFDCVNFLIQEEPFEIEGQLDDKHVVDEMELSAKLLKAAPNRFTQTINFSTKVPSRNTHQPKPSKTTGLIETGLGRTNTLKNLQQIQLGGGKRNRDASPRPSISPYQTNFGSTSPFNTKPNMEATQKGNAKKPQPAKTARLNTFRKPDNRAVTPTLAERKNPKIKETMGDLTPRLVRKGAEQKKQTVSKSPINGDRGPIKHNFKRPVLHSLIPKDTDQYQPQTRENKRGADTVLTSEFDEPEQANFEVCDTFIASSGNDTFVGLPIDGQEMQLADIIKEKASYIEENMRISSTRQNAKHIDMDKIEELKRRRRESRSRGQSARGASLELTIKDTITGIQKRLCEEQKQKEDRL